MDERLDDDELRRWQAWKRATDSVWDQVARAVTLATGLSGPDFSVLTRLVEEGDGSLRQQRLSDDLRWERSRLSRHLARMEQRGLVERSGDTATRLVTATPEGRALVGPARAAHAAAVRAALLTRTNDDPTFWRTVEQLAGR
ncbi:MarR family winged helix-turn-helix transcriptional regulator [Curtobacterium pusillum]|uniref:MarR family winged helix-turn-helix transcriptional regulator n=1 Tax=Curtobacterium pusillum TaxID=69373 RepID=UPI00119D9D81|nr:MarR family transcriptional regulator [Curtobacterium pusillum]